MRYVGWIAFAWAVGVGCRHQPVIEPRVVPVVERGLAGVVFDSLAGSALRDARVELADASHPELRTRTLLTDSLGHFADSELAPGRYVATFYHRRLDSLGIVAATFLLDLRGPGGLWVDFGVPSARKLRSVLCGTRALSDSTGVVFGRVFDARTRAPLYGAVVRGEWLDLDVRFGNGVRFGRPHTEASSRTDGSFVLCGMPITTDISVDAAHPGKRSGTIGVHLGDGLAYRDLFLSDTQHVVIHGNVLGANGGPIPRAHVAIASSHTEAVADENGVFSLTVDRAGTQTVVARAIGYYQEERTVDVFPDSAQWIELELPTMVSVLDTVHVRGRRFNEDPHGFNDRRNAGIGTFLTDADISAAIPRSATDLIERSPATPLARLPNGHLGVRVRGVACLPMLILNGHSLPILQDVAEIDNLVDLTNIARMEIYTAGEIPRQFMQGSPCAAIVVWTKRS
jgi:hypothetical protein